VPTDPFGAMKQITYITATVLTVALCVIAILLTLGRILMSSDSLIEPWVSQVIEAQGLQYEGVSGGWNLINPTISIEKIQFPNGSVHNIYHELDTLESLFRWTWVAKRVHVDHVQVFLQSATKLPNTDFELPNLIENKFLLYSDEIFIETLGIAIQTQSRSHFFLGSLHSGDFENHQIFRLDLTSLTCEECELHVAVDLVRESYFASGHLGNVKIRVRDFPIHPDLIGISQIPEASFSVDFRGHETGAEFVGQGEFEIALGSEQNTKLNASLRVSSDHEITIGEIQDIVAKTESQNISLGSVTFSSEDSETVFRGGSIKIDDVASVLLNTFGTQGDLGEWLTHLEPQGVLHYPVLLMDGEMLAIQADATDVSISAHKDAPGLEIDRIAISGDVRFPRLRVHDSDVKVRVARYFEDEWQFDQASGTAYVGIFNNHVSFFIHDTRVHYDGAMIQYELGLSRDLQSENYQITNLALSDETQFSKEKSMTFLPTLIGEDVPEWIQQRIKSASVRDIDFIHHYFRSEDELETVNDLRLAVAVSEANVDYMDDWPELQNGAGQIFVFDELLQIKVDKATVFGEEIDQGVVSIPFGADTFDVNFSLTTDPNKMVQFVLVTELDEYFASVKNTWVGEGAIGLTADLTLSYDGDTEKTKVGLDFDLQRVQLGDTELDLYLDDLVGQFSYQSPFNLEGTGITGLMFGFPLRLNVKSELATIQGVDTPINLIHFDFEGKINDSDIYGVLGGTNLSFAEGTMEFDGRYTVNGEGIKEPKLVIRSDLYGLQIDAPQPLQLSKNQIRPSTLSITFKDTHNELDIVTGASEAWLDFADGKVLRGMIGFDSEIRSREAIEDELVLTGTIVEWTYEIGDASSDSFARLRLEELKVGALHFEEMSLQDIKLDALFDSDQWNVSFDSEMISGTVEQPADDLMNVHLTKFNWVSSATEEQDGSDPLHPSIVESLVPMHLKVDQFGLFSEDQEYEDYGSWSMTIHPSDDGLRITDLVSDVKGLHIETQADAFWDIKRNISQFDVSVSGTDLGEVLDAWGFDTQMESERFELVGNLYWPGSPLAYEISNVSGAFRATSRDGRFLEIAPNPALRIISLLNISTIVDRLQLDFGDVLFKGYAYEDISIGGVADEGILRLDKPLRIKGRSTELTMLGSVNMDSEEVNLEVIATLPLHKALPWYSAAMAVANPAFGAGLLVTATTMHDQIRQLTSGRYKVEGSLTDPKVSFIGMFDVSLSDASNLQVPDTKITQSTEDLGTSENMIDPESTYPFSEIDSQPSQ